MSNNYPQNNSGSNDLPGYNDYASGNSGDTNPYEQTGPYGQDDYATGAPNSYGAPAFPHDAQDNGAMFDSSRPGAWKRLLALIIDGLLVQAFIGGILLAAICGSDLVDWYHALKTANSPEEVNHLFPNGKLALWGLIILIMWLTYRVLMESKKGATVGKMAIGARVVSTDGQNISAVDSLKRNSWYILGGLLGAIPGVGPFVQLAVYIAVGVTIGRSPEKQSFTDKFAHAYVVDKSTYYGVQ